MSDERLQILNMIEEGRITPDEGLELLKALSGGADGTVEITDTGKEGETASSLPGTETLSEETPAAENTLPHTTEAACAAPPDWASSRHLWLVSLAVGGVLSAVGLGFIVLIQITWPGSFFLICGLIPFLLGLTTVLLSFWSRTARWLHVRIRGEQRLSISFPLPLRLAGWILRLVRPWVPQLEKTGLDEVILSLDESLTGEGGFYVDVQDDEDGERVQVYIG